MSRAWAWRLAALGAGVVGVLAFPRPGLWWFAWIALVPWILVVRAAPTGREAGIRSWASAAGFLLATHHWLVSYLSVFALPVFAAFALLWLPWGRLVWRLIGPKRSRSEAVAALALVPSAWVVIELVRSWHLLGGPWALVGESQWNSPPTLSTAALGGVWLVSCLVVAVNVGLALAVTRSAAAPVRVAGAVVALVAFATGPVWHAFRTDPRPIGRVRVALVQSGLGETRHDRFDQAVLATREVADDVDLVVWGESSVKFDLAQRDDVRRDLEVLAAELDAGLLVNVDARREDGRVAKSAVLVSEDGIAGTYEKTRLVPFGEYVPLRRLLGWTASLTPAADEDRRRGDGTRVFRADGTRIGPLVSFELAFPDLARRVANGGAELIAVQSMTSSFQSTWAPEQHASRAAVRAMETGRPVVDVGITGVSNAFDGRGRELAWLGPDERGAVVAAVPLSRERTPYDRLGDWVPIASALVVLIWVAARARSRTSPSTGRRFGA